MARVALEQVDKVYPGGTHAIAALSLDVADGELLVLVGPSGCGKSTVLRLVAGLEEKTGGTIRIGDHAVDDLGPQERNVAMVFQDYALYPHMTARGNLEFPLRMRGLAREERRARAERVAGTLDIAPVLDRLPKQLSGGQRQRVAMGRALVREPAVFLMDEPLSNLDAKLRVQVRAEIKDLQRRTGTTTIYVTHDQVESMTLGDRIAVLDRGRLQQVATPVELYERPVNVFVAAFLGNPPMNVFPATVAGDAGRAVLHVGDQVLALAPDGRVDPAAVRTAGVRPESLHVVADGARGAGLAATVAHVENLGHETLVHADVASVRLVTRVPGMSALRPGDRVTLAVDARAVHFFDERGVALRA